METLPLKQYRAVIERDGKRLSETLFSDWFTDDESARVGYTQIMAEQGYAVASVTIGNPCVVCVS